MRTRRPSGSRPRGATLAAAALSGMLSAWLPLARAAEPAPADAAGAPAEKAALEIEGHLMCHCGCTDLTVRVCNCGVAAGIKDDIRDRLARGQSPAEVMAAYVARFGEQIRSAPTREGFNLLAWIMPFAAVLAAGGILVVLIRRWGARPAVADAPAAPGAAGSGPDRASLERVDRAVRDLL